MSFQRSKFRSTPEATARILLLIDAFSHSRTGKRTLEGRVKLAKLDFLMRYPQHLARMLNDRPNASRAITRLEEIADSAPIDSRMMRYRYGPWDPSYYAILGNLIGRGLVEIVPLPQHNGLGYRTTDRGETVASRLRDDESFRELDERSKDLRRHFDLNGSTLKKLLYTLPEIAEANWHEELE